MISVIIPLYNKQNYVKDTIESVLNQSITAFELIIVNDGSTDKSLDIVNNILDARIKVISINNGGVSNARNTGIKHSKFEWIALLDADDLWESNYLRSAIDIIKYNNANEVIATNYYKIQGNKKVIALNLKKGFIKSYFITPCLTSSSVIINKKIFEIVGFFDTKLKYGEDQHLWFRITSKFKVFFNDKPLVNYRLIDHSFSNIDFSKRDINSDLVSIINDLEINVENWDLFKNKYILCYLRPYYICDTHLNSVKHILRTISINKNNFILFLFYLFPRFIVKPIYKYYFSNKYT